MTRTLGLTLTLLALAAPSQSQVTSPGAPSQSDTAWERFAAVAVEARQHATVVTLAVRVPTGSADDPAGLEGTAWVLGQSLARRAGRLLAPLPAEVVVDVGRRSTTFVVTSEPSSWPDALATLEGVLFGSDFSVPDAESVRDRLISQLRFVEGSPVEDFRRRSPEILAEPGAAWSRPTRGYLATVSAVQGADAERMRIQAYRAGQATVAVLGAVDPATLAAPEVPSAVDDTPASPRPDFAWSESRDVTEIQEVTNSWLSIAAPLPAGLGRTVQEFVRATVDATLTPSVADPYRYSLDVRLVEAPGGPVLVVDAAVAPEAATDLEARIRGIFEGSVRVPFDDDFFSWGRRRFRADALLRDSDPVQAARRITEDLFREGSPRNLRDEIWVLSPQEIDDVLRAFGPSRVFRLGPDLMGGG